MKLPATILIPFQGRTTLVLIFFFLFSGVCNVRASQIKIAVASNFSAPLKYLAHQFELQTSHKVIVISGSSGKLYAQIIHGAPYDAFFSADKTRPELLEQQGQALKDSRFTYAYGKLLLWSPDPQLIKQNSEVLFKQNFGNLAMANPRLAPYGQAAQEVLEALGLWQRLKHKTIRGENIAQTWQFVSSGNTPMGFVARSQVFHPNHNARGSWWNIPDHYYNPIEQQAVQLKDNHITQSFLSYIKSPPALEIIQSFGYGIPHAQ